MRRLTRLRQERLPALVHSALFMFNPDAIACDVMHHDFAIVLAKRKYLKNLKTSQSLSASSQDMRA